MNYLCQHCKQTKASVHITDVPDKKERHLCEKCAQLEGVIVKQSHQTTNAILQEFIQQKAGISPVDDRVCSKCGMTFREFRIKGQLGCPHDYEVFRDLLAPLIARAHGGGTHHVGKVPSTADAIVKRQAGVLKLRQELQEAIDQENYERAAHVRDQIQTIEKAECSPGSN